MRSAGSKRRHSDDEFKQPLSAFFLFLESIRPELRADRRSAVEQAKLAGGKWKALSPAERAIFNDEAGGKRKAYRER